MTKTFSAGAGVQTSPNCWSFGGDIPRVFDSHIKQSIPGYEHGHELVLMLSDFFCLADSTCYEIGSSTGTLLKKLAHKHHAHKPGIQWIGLDCISEMVEYAKHDKSINASIDFIHADIRDYALEKSDLIVSYYAIQFIPPRDRQEVLNKIYNSLNWGGGFIWFEKVRGPDARFQDMLTNLYHNFKLQQGFSAEEILNKAESLKTVLEPFSQQGNLELLTRAGFKDVMPVFRDLCFEGVVCIK